MPPSNDLYAILQVPPSADLLTVKTAFRRLARQYHPDVNASPGALEVMKRLNHAYEVLADPVTRAAYDRSRTSAPLHGATATEETWSNEGRKKDRRFAHLTLDDLVRLLEESRVEVVDNRGKKGALWIIGGLELRWLNEELSHLGLRFLYRPKGGRASKHRPGWLLGKRS